MVSDGVGVRCQQEGRPPMARFVLLASALLVVAACSGGTATSNPTASAGSAPSSTPSASAASASSSTPVTSASNASSPASSVPLVPIDVALAPGTYASRFDPGFPFTAVRGAFNNDEPALVNYGYGVGVDGPAAELFMVPI